MLRSFYGLIACLLVCCLLAGCGGGTGVKTYPVKGTVKLKGQPLANAVVTFYPVQGRPAAGTTDEQGAFFLSTHQSQDGAPAGSYKVTVSEPAEENLPMPNPDDPPPQPKPSRFPVRYTDQNESALTAEVKPGADNNFTFDLTD